MNEINSSAKALVAIVDFGFIKVEGLMMPDGRYTISVSQANKILNFSTHQNHAARNLKALLGNGFEHTKIKTELSNNVSSVITIQQFKKLLIELTKRGNSIASSFVEAIVEEGIERRFDIAFGNKVEEAERNERLALRMARLLARHQWTDTLMERHLQLFGVKPTPNQYKDWTVRVNRALFEKDHFCCNRDNMNDYEQRTIELFESMCVRQASKYPTENPDYILDKTLAIF
jgi:hypothetical protein